MLKDKSTKVRPKAGRKPHEPTKVSRDQVLAFCGMGLTHGQICKLLGISTPTLYKNYRDELDTGEARMNFNVANNLYNIATDPTHKSGAQAAMFWMKTRARWRETNRLEHTGPDGQPIATNNTSVRTIDASVLNSDQRQALRELMESALATALQNSSANGNLIEQTDYAEEDEEAEEGGEEEDYADDEQEGEE
jgi:hypothetical protein